MKGNTNQCWGIKKKLQTLKASVTINFFFLSRSGSSPANWLRVYEDQGSNPAELGINNRLLLLYN